MTDMSLVVSSRLAWVLLVFSIDYYPCYAGTRRGQKAVHPMCSAPDSRSALQ